jgi:hypothetical protein
MQDGSVHLVRIWTPPAGATIWNPSTNTWSDPSITASTPPSTFTDLVDPATVTGLADWQIMCPGHYIAGASAVNPFNYTTDSKSVWQKNRPYNYK